MVTSTIVGFDHGTDGLDGGIEPLRDFLVGGFERARPRRHRIEIGGQAGAVGAERMQLIGKPNVGPISLATTLGRGFQAIERLHQAPCRSFNRAGIRHHRPTSLQDQLREPQNLMRGKKLEMEPYVAWRLPVNAGAHFFPLFCGWSDRRTRQKVHAY
jgi:hypothetical protein